MNIIILGATSQIAKELGRAYSAEGHEFFLVGRDPGKLSHIKADFLIRGASSAHAMTADLDDPNAYENILVTSKSIFKKIDLLIIAHGTLPKQREIENSFHEVESYARTNFLSYISLLTLFAKTFENQQSGSIAVFTSVAGVRGRRSNYLYGSFKGGVQTFLEGYAARMSRSNVCVLDIRPGLINTPMTVHLENNLLFSKPSDVAQDIKDAITKRKKVLYTPSYWRFVMVVIRWIPNKIFYGLDF